MSKRGRHKFQQSPGATHVCKRCGGKLGEDQHRTTKIRPARPGAPMVVIDGERAVERERLQRLEMTA